MVSAGAFSVRASAGGNAGFAESPRVTFVISMDVVRLLGLSAWTTAGEQKIKINNRINNIRCIILEMILG
jgi:hypothetical protein